MKIAFIGDIHGRVFHALAAVVKWQIVHNEKIDLVVLRAQEEGRIEHFIISGSNDAIIRKMPCSIFLVKDELVADAQ